MLKLKLQYFGHLMQRADHLKRPWCWQRLKAGGEGADRGWDGWMASPTQQTWVWVNSGSWWWTGRAGMLWSMGSQRVRHDWATELNWTRWGAAKLVFTNCHTILHFHQQCTRVLIALHPCQKLFIFHFVDYGHLVGMKLYLIVVLICISQMTNNEPLFMFIGHKSLRKCLFKSFVHSFFKIVLSVTES